MYQGNGNAAQYVHTDNLASTVNTVIPVVIPPGNYELLFFPVSWTLDMIWSLELLPKGWVRRAAAVLHFPTCKFENTFMFIDFSGFYSFEWFFIHHLFLNSQELAIYIFWAIIFCQLYMPHISSPSKWL